MKTKILLYNLLIMRNKSSSLLIVILLFTFMSLTIHAQTLQDVKNAVKPNSNKGQNGNKQQRVGSIETVKYTVNETNNEKQSNDNYIPTIYVFFIMDTLKNDSIGADIDYANMYLFFKKLASDCGFNFKPKSFNNLSGFGIKKKIFNAIREISTTKKRDYIVFCNASHGKGDIATTLPLIYLDNTNYIPLSDIKDSIVKKNPKMAMIINSSCNAVQPYEAEKPAIDTYLENNPITRNNLNDFFNKSYISNTKISSSFKNMFISSDKICIYNSTKRGKYGWGSYEYGNFFFWSFLHTAYSDAKIYNTGDDLVSIINTKMEKMNIDQTAEAYCEKIFYDINGNAYLDNSKEISLFCGSWLRINSNKTYYISQLKNQFWFMSNHFLFEKDLQEIAIVNFKVSPNNKKCLIENNINKSPGIQIILTDDNHLKIIKRGIDIYYFERITQ